MIAWRRRREALASRGLGFASPRVRFSEERQVKKESEQKVLWADERGSDLGQFFFSFASFFFFWGRRGCLDPHPLAAGQ